MVTATSRMLELRLDALEQQVARDRRRLMRMRMLCCGLVMTMVGTMTLAAANRRPVDDVVQARRHRRGGRRRTTFI